MDEARIPVVVSAGQVTERNETVSAVELAARASEAALESCPQLRSRIERATMVSVVFSPVSSRPGSELTARLGLTGAAAETSYPGGNLPQWLVNRAAEEIRDGALGTTLIAGGEATRSMRAANPDAPIMGLRPGATDEEPDPIVGPSIRGMLGPAELAIRLWQPTDLYALFEAANAAAQGRTFDEQRTFLGPLMSDFSRVASQHPHAWFQEALSADEIARVTDDNRLIAEPYPKRMNAFPNVDQGAAAVVTSLATARELGLEDRCMFVWAGASMKESVPATRRELHDAPAMRRSSAAVLEAAGIGADDLRWIDLYSCFPIAVQVGAAGLGIALDDSRGLTITGGLPFFGGPGNNYSLHAIATLLDRIREGGGLGYVGANGGMLSKHSMGVYGSTPPPSGFVLADTAAAQEEVEAAALPVVLEADASATVVGATVLYARDGSVSSAPAIADLDDGSRVVGQADDAIKDSLAGTQLAGRRIRVSGSPLRYVVEA